MTEIFLVEYDTCDGNEACLAFSTKELAVDAKCRLDDVSYSVRPMVLDPDLTKLEFRVVLDYAGNITPYGISISVIPLPPEKIRHEFHSRNIFERVNATASSNIIGKVPLLYIWLAASDKEEAQLLSHQYYIELERSGKYDDELLEWLGESHFHELKCNSMYALK